MRLRNAPTAVLAALALAASFSSCVTPDLPQAREIDLSFDTRPAPMPANPEWRKVGQAHELINISDLVVVVSGGADPLPDEEWAAYKPRLPWVKNIQRNLLFTETAFLHSPRISPQAVGEERYAYRTISGHTWLELAQPISVLFIPEGTKTDIMKPAPGHLVVKTIKKPQILRYSGTIYQLGDGRGNYYVMHATEIGSPTLDVTLPPGWTLRRLTLDEDLVISPSVDGYYNILGDHRGQGYHQYIFASPTWPDARP